MKIAHRHSRVRQCNDNAHVERFNRTLQDECLTGVVRSVPTFRAALKKYLPLYNTDRMHMGIDYKMTVKVTTEAGVAEQSERFGEIARDLGGGPFEWATKPEDRTRLWQARHDAYWAGRGLRPGAQAVATDVCVPLSRLAECVAETQRDVAEHNLMADIAKLRARQRNQIAVVALG